MTCLLLKLFIIVVIVSRSWVSPCNFPDSLQIQTHDPPWFSHIRSDGSRDAEYYIRHNVMEIHYPKGDRPRVRWKCAMTFHEKLLLKRQDHLVNSYYVCVRFVFRSRSIVQIMWSHEVKTFDLALCDDLNLKPDPWPLIWYGTLEEDYSPCPFSGGFDMKIVDSQLGENGCNLMLRPMRMEAECLGGEGVTFNFMSSNCLPAVKMFVKQRTICAGNWKDSKNHYVILRRNEDTDLWCLVIPIHRKSNFTGHLFSDLACLTDTDQLKSVTNIRFYTLHLQTRVVSTLCEDEYDQCSKVTCNTYVKHECHKSCAVCDSSSVPTDSEFPEDFIGSWFLKDLDTYSQIYIGSSNFTVEGVGHFLSVTFPNSPARTSLFYTLLSLYENGCRPRYTCVMFHRVGPSVLQYGLSQSYVWPLSESDISGTICNQDRFHPDPSPIDDRYRPHEGASKPIISQSPEAEPVSCNLTSVHTVSATLPKGYICSGSLYPYCEDSSRFRLDFDSCGALIAASTEYRCLADFTGHYWERILLVQNVHDKTSAICFVFSQFYPNEAYVLVASQCDQKSFSYSRSGLRQPLLKFRFRLEPEPCKSVPAVVTSTEATHLRTGYTSVSSSVKDDHTTLTNISRVDSVPPSPVPILVTGKTGHAFQNGLYREAEDGPVEPRSKSTSFGDEDSLRSAQDNESQMVTARTSMIVVSATISLLYR